MPAITKIKLTIITGSDSGAGTDGQLYFGIGGREFRCIRPSENVLEPPTPEHLGDVFIFGENTTVANPHLNDPNQGYKMNTEHLNKFPTYLRFEPNGDNDNWQLDKVDLIVNPGQASQKIFSALTNGYLWLGERNGKYFYLTESN